MAKTVFGKLLNALNNPNFEGLDEDGSFKLPIAESIYDERDYAIPNAKTVLEAIGELGSGGVEATTTKAGGVRLANNVADDDAVMTVKMAKDWLVPVGTVYFQQRGRAEPADLYGFGEWQNISSSFQGQFFRAEGGNAAPFGGTQNDAMRNLTGSIAWGKHGSYWTECMTATGIFKKTSPQGVPILQSTGNVTQGVNTHASIDLAAAGIPIANEIRPINSTMRIWLRTA
jgi:hypothetical protein